jgi:hypothetical protein
MDGRQPVQSQDQYQSGDERQIHCAAAPSLPGFSAHVGPMFVSPKGASCGTAVYRREPVNVTDILSDSLWDDYRDSMSPYGIRAVWSRPLFSGDGKVLGTLAILYREARGPGTAAVFVLVELAYLQFEHHVLALAVVDDVSHRARRLAQTRSLIAFGLFLTVSSKFPLCGFGLVCCAVLLYLRPEPPGVRGDGADTETEENERKTLLLVLDDLGRGLVEVQLLCKAGPTQTPACSWVGDRQCVRKVRAPAVMPWIARYG